MESDELEAPEDPGEPGANGALESPPSTPERARRLRRFAVQVDSHSSLLNATRRLRRQLPGDEQFGDPLSTAGAQPVEVLGRTVSSLQPDRKSVLAELGFAGLQVWQSLSEAAGRGRGTQEMAVMFTDLAASRRGRSRPATSRRWRSCVRSGRAWRRRWSSMRAGSSSAWATA